MQGRIQITTIITPDIPDCLAHVGVDWLPDQRLSAQRRNATLPKVEFLPRATFLHLPASSSCPFPLLHRHLHKHALQHISQGPCCSHSNSERLCKVPSRLAACDYAEPLARRKTSNRNGPNHNRVVTAAHHAHARPLAVHHREHHTVFRYPEADRERPQRHRVVQRRGEQSMPGHGSRL